jgi:hypothetical protein
MIILRKYSSIFLVIILLFFFNFRGSAQLKIAAVTPPQLDNDQEWNARTMEDDTLSLPLWDDFSYGGGFPSPEIWTNSPNVLINYSLGIRPPTLGVATFDGATANGGIYNTNQEAVGIADSLVSKPIDLSTLGPTEINSVYLSFFWQFYGFPEIPDAEDSLRLFFKNQQNEWEVIDVFDRDRVISSDTFQQVIYKVEPRFLHMAFQFKFENKARLSGSYDSWHIDYVYLNKGRSVTDLVYLDRAITHPPDYIFDGYSAVPIEQFVTDPSKFIIPSKVDIYNLDDLLQPIEYTAIIRDTFDKNRIIDTLNYNTEVNPPLQGLERRTLYTNELDVDNLDLSSDSIFLTMDFYISSGDTISEGVIDYRVNDTTSFDYALTNYFATDDGTAEFGLGLEQLDGQLAYMFVMEAPDVINRVDIHFPNIGRDQAGTAFSFRVWRRLTDNPDDLLFERQDMAIAPITSFNEFQTITLSDIYVTDTFYVGYEQRTNLFMAVGFDKQHDAGERIFYNVLGEWIPNTDHQGSLMIRPFFGDREPTGIDKESTIKPKIYPNPTTGIIRVEGRFDRLTLYDLLGNTLIDTDEPDDHIEFDLSSFKEGLYIIRVSSGGIYFTEKVLKMR